MYLVNGKTCDTNELFSFEVDHWLEQKDNYLVSSEVWSALCKHHYNLQPLPQQDPYETFYGEYCFQKAKSAWQLQDGINYRRSIQQALKLDNYNALEWVCLKALKNSQIKRALFYARKASKIYWAAGHMLQSCVFHASSAIIELTDKQRKNAIISALMHLQVAIELTPLSQSAMHNANWNVSSEALAELEKQYAQTLTLTKQDYQKISNRAKKVLQVYL